MDQLRSYFYFFLFLIRLKQSFQFNNGYTDPLTLEEYEEDVELIKIRFDTTRPCRFFCEFSFGRNRNEKKHRNLVC